MATTKYAGVYKNEKTGYFFYNVELGVDQITGKRIQKKGSRDSHGLPENDKIRMYSFDKIKMYK